MKQAFAALVLSVLVFRAGGAEPEKPDPKAVCLQLVGTFASAGDPRTPKQPSLSVAFAEEKFTVVDCRGKMKTEQVIPTKEGLIFVEANRDRNVFRLTLDAKQKEYYLEHLGKVREGRPLPTKADFRSKLVKIDAPGVKEKEADKKQ